MNTINKFGIALITLLLAFSSCKKDNDEPTTIDTPTEDSVVIDKAAFVLSLDLESQGLYPLHYIEDSEAGSADIVDAQEILKSGGVVPVVGLDGVLYVNDYTGKKFVKLVLKDGILTSGGAIPNLGVNSNPLYTFSDASTILLTSAQLSPKDGVYSYQVIDINTMTEESTKTYSLPVNSSHPDYSTVWANQYVGFEGNVYVPFVDADEDWGPLSDTAKVAVYDSKGDFVKTIKTTKTDALCNGQNPSYAIGESGDLYMASNSNLDSKPSGIVKIKSGETDFDDSYFLNITELTGFQSLAMQYFGNDKAIVQVFNSNLEDYYVEYYVVDLIAKTANKLSVPASSGGYYGGRKSLALLSNGNVAIISNTATESAVYIYHPTTNEVTKGITYSGADAITGVMPI